MRDFKDFNEIKASIGLEIGVSDWVEVTRNALSSLLRLRGIISGSMSMSSAQSVSCRSIHDCAWIADPLVCTALHSLGRAPGGIEEHVELWGQSRAVCHGRSGGLAAAGAGANCSSGRCCLRRITGHLRA